MASSLFNLRALQSFCTISLQVFFGLPLGLCNMHFQEINLQFTLVVVVAVVAVVIYNNLSLLSAYIVVVSEQYQILSF